MDVVGNNFMPGDHRLIDQIVYELKSQGIFDQFRKECISDVDTKPAYQNLRQRVEGSVTSFLSNLCWKSDMNKNHVRELLRKNIYESGYLESGVERIVDQVVNPKINTIFLPKVEDVVYRFLGIANPEKFQKTEIKKHIKIDVEDLLPTDLEAVSPESVHDEKEIIESTSIKKVESMDHETVDEDESPPFETLDESGPQEDISVDSNVSGFSGLASHESSHSADTKLVNQNHDSQVSSNDRLSIITAEEVTKMDTTSDDSEVKEVANIEVEKLVENQDKDEKKDEQNVIKSEKKSRDSDRHKSSKRDKERHESRDKTKSKESIKKHSSSSSKDLKDKKDYKRDKSKSDDRKDKAKHEEKDKSKRDKSKGSSRDSSKQDKDKNSSSSKERSSKDNRTDKDKSMNTSDKKDKSSSSKSSTSKKDTSSSKRDSSTSSKKDTNREKKSSSSSNKDRESSSKKSSSSDSKISKSTSEKHRTSSETDRKPSSSSSSRHSSSKKDRDKDRKSVKDDHYSNKEKKSDRRSTDRDSNDGSTTSKPSRGTSSQNENSTTEKSSTKETSLSSSGNSGESSGNSDQSIQQPVDHPAVKLDVSNVIQKIKYIKPKIASNIQEAMALSRIRKQLAKMERQNEALMENYLSASNNTRHVHEQVIAETDKSKASTVEVIKEINSLDLQIPAVETLKQTAAEEEKAEESTEKDVLKVLDSDSGKKIIKINEKSLVVYLTKIVPKDYDFKKLSYSAERREDQIKEDALQVEVTELNDMISEEVTVSENITEYNAINIDSSQIDEAHGLQYLCEEEIVSTQEDVVTVDEATIEVENEVHIENCIEDVEMVEQTVNESCEENGLLRSEDRVCALVQQEIPNNPSDQKVDMTHNKLNNGLKFGLNVVIDSSNTCCRYLDKPSPQEEKVLHTLYEFIDLLKRHVEELTLKVQNNIPSLRNTKRNFNQMGIVNEMERKDSRDLKKMRLSNYNGMVSTDLKEKLIDIPGHTQTFSLPLSPTDSENSIENNKKHVTMPELTKSKRTPNRNLVKNNQFYSSDDLYKPRPVFTSSRRNRSAKLDDN